MMLSIFTKSRNRATGKFRGLAAALLLALSAGRALAETPHNIHIKFANVADSTQGFSGFSQFPAINNRGAVAFVAAQNGGSQCVFKWERRKLTPIASASG